MVCFVGTLEADMTTKIIIIFIIKRKFTDATNLTKNLSSKLLVVDKKKMTKTPFWLLYFGDTINLVFTFL